jgi:hypothetical protein
MEHLPPRATGNNSVVAARPPAVEFTRHELLDIFTSWSEGHAVPTLCEDCNGKAGDWRYPKEYTLWHRYIESWARSLVAAEPSCDPFDPAQTWIIELPKDRLNPRRFIGHCVAMLLATQSDFDLWADHPELRALIGSDIERGQQPPGAVDIHPIRVFLGLANQNYLVGRSSIMALSFRAPQHKRPSGLIVPPGPTTTRDLHVFAYSPFAVTLVVGDSTPPWPSVEITYWSRMGHHDRLGRNHRELTIPTVRGTMFDGLSATIDDASG